MTREAGPSGKPRLFAANLAPPGVLAKLRSRAILALFLVLVFGLSASFCTTYVHPNEWGIKQVYFGPRKGIQEKRYETGLHWVWKGVETIHRFPRDYQVLEMTSTASERTSRHRTLPAMRIQTKEGYNVDVDVTVIYQIVDPYKVINLIGPGTLYEDSFVIPRCDKELRKILGALDAEDFYKEDERITKTAEAQQELRADLIEKGVETKAVLLRAYRYDEKYQAMIESRKIQDQTVFKNQAEARAATEEANKNRVAAEGIASVAVEKSRGEAEGKRINADADLYRRTRAAEGDLLVKTAEAEGTRLQNEALRGAGADLLVGLEMAGVLEGAKRIIVPAGGKGGLNPLNVGSLLDLFDVAERPAAPSHSADPAGSGGGR